MTDSRTGLSPDLVQTVAAQKGDELLDVVVELHPDDADAASIAGARDSFERAKQPVAELISQVGGSVTGEAWINHTLRASVPANALQVLSGLDQVDAVDVPHPITPE
jgi:hypothetical protein